MRTPSLHRRGNCLLQVMFAIAVLGLLLAIFGIVTMATSGAGDAVKDLEKQLTTIVETATTFEAPGKATLELKDGAAMVGVLPSAEVNGKKIGAPAAGVTFKVTVTDAEGKSVEFRRVNVSRDPNAPFEPLGVFKVESAGTYSVEATSSDGSPAAVFVSGGSQEEVDRLTSSGLALLQGIGGGCSTICGLALAVVFGLIAAVIKFRRKEPDPLEHV